VAVGEDARGILTSSNDVPMSCCYSGQRSGGARARTMARARKSMCIRICQTYNMRCYDVTEEALTKLPDRARHVLELVPQVPVSDSPCRTCVCLGRTCHRASYVDPCESCIRYGRPCSSNLGGVKRKGMYSDEV